MEITKESIGELNEVVKIQLKPEDYKEKVDIVIKNTRKKVQMPGFRQGHVPEGLVKKMYGKAILVEELNKIVSESLDKFITENKIDILGHPLPYNEKNDSNNWENPSEFEFMFELGLAPQFNLNLPPDHTFPYYEIQVDEAKTDTYVDDIRKKYGKFSNPEVSEASSVLYASFTEVDKDNQPVINGITTTTTLTLDLVKDEKIKASLTGLKKDETAVIDLIEAMNNDTEVSYMLNIPKDKIPGIQNNFAMKIISVNKVEKAELNQELFDKVYGKDAVTGETEFRDKIKSEISAMFAVESDRKLQHDIEDELLNQFKFSLPDNFLKRWLKNVNEKPVTPEQIEKEYNGYARGMKLKLIENRIIKENDIKVTQEEIESFAKRMIINQFAQYGNSYLTDEMVSDMTKRYMSKEENVRKIIESLSERKVFNYLNSIVKKDVKTVSYDEFMKIVREHQHEH